MRGILGGSTSGLGWDCNWKVSTRKKAGDRWCFCSQAGNLCPGNCLPALQRPPARQWLGWKKVRGGALGPAARRRFMGKRSRREELEVWVLFCRLLGEGLGVKVW